MNWLAATLAYAAVLAFALAMTPHHRAVFNGPTPPRRMWALRVSGAVCSALAVAGFITAQGWQTGIVAALAALSVASFALTLLLAYRPRWIGWPVVALLVAAVSSALAR